MGDFGIKEIWYLLMPLSELRRIGQVGDLGVEENLLRDLVFAYTDC